MIVISIITCPFWGGDEVDEVVDVVVVVVAGVVLSVVVVLLVVVVVDVVVVGGACVVVVGVPQLTVKVWSVVNPKSPPENTSFPLTSTVKDPSPFAQQIPSRYTSESKIENLYCPEDTSILRTTVVPIAALELGP